MKIEKLKTNHIVNPLGYRMQNISLSWVVTEAAGNYAVKTRVQIATDAALTNLVHDSGERGDISSVDYAPEFALQPGTRYYWQVQVWDDAGDCGTSDNAWFEPAVEMKAAHWIKAPFAENIQPLMRKTVILDREVTRARLYICGLGVYEAYVNGEKIGDEHLAPYYNDYNLWLQYQTYDVTAQLQKGENCLGVMLGNGWYKGRFGYIEHLDKLYGTVCHMICELHLTFADGSEQIIPSDESWQCAPSPVLKSSIYDGEVWDSRRKIPHWNTVDYAGSDFAPAVLCEENSALLTPRMSLPVKIMERVKPVELIHTTAYELVIDFGQEVTGWVEFRCAEPADTEIMLQYGEILQQGKFYNDNLRTAKAEYHYIADGKETWVRPHFTFYGFRYVKVSGMREVNLADFVACVLYSEMERTGSIETSNPKVNRLIQNASWGQKGNFLDTPTDCPQRDERMGWTGDAQVFSPTANFFMYTPAFYAKYLHDMKLEQDALGGSVPNVVPNILGQIGRLLARQGKETDNAAVVSPNGSCAWGDAAAVIPWTVYRSFGDKELLAAQYGNMKDWVDHIRKVDVERCGGKYLWTDGFHFADWLALDNFHQDSCYGATDPYFVASAYYYYSTCLTAKAADVLGKAEDTAYYHDLAAHIKEAFLAEYYTKTGRLAQETQTALAIVLWLDLIPTGARQRQVDTLVAKIHEENDHLTTGFVGTPLLCPVLTENGHADLAYTLLFNEDFPGWLYEVNMGATTVWERWNSVLPDGSISDTGMNSLNHYAYGAIVEWMVRFMCGLNMTEPAYTRFTVAPYPDARLDWAKLSYASAQGEIRCEWKRQDDCILYTVEVPFGTQADFVLPQDAAVTEINGTVHTPLKQGERFPMTKGVYHIYIK